MATSCLVDGIYNQIPIGQPIYNTQAYILDERQKLLPLGAVGEICISGDSLAEGYLNNEEMTASKFVANPFDPEKRMYKTGDLGRWRPDGNLEFIGRIDDQVKIRGFRIELGEIENVLHRQIEVKDGSILVWERSDDIKHLVGYVVTDGALNTEALEKKLKKHLPDYMVPRLWVQMEELPLTPNGKLDKKSLPDPEIGLGELPQGELEEGLARLWKEILDLEEVGREDSFFDLGGSSLKVIQLTSYIYKQYEVQLSIRDVFKHPQLSSQAELIRGASHTSYKAIEKADEKERYALSNAQQRLWIIDQLNPGQVAYNISQAVRLEGQLDKGRLHQTFEKLIQRHESLRTYFQQYDEQVVQFISKEVELNIEQYTAEEEQISSVIHKFIKPFDLSDNSLIRVGLIKINPTNHILMVDMHHIISDGISMDIMVNEFMALYNDEKLPAVDLQYKDYAEWQQSEDQQEKIKQQKEFWLNEFADELSPLQLPVDFSRPVTKKFSGDSIGFELSLEEYEQLKTICNKEEVTVFMVTFALFGILLSKLGDTEDLVIGTPTAGRPHPDLDNLIGMFVNTLCIRNYPKGAMSFKEYLSDVKSRVLACFENESYPYEQLINDLQVDRDTRHNPLFDVLFSYIKFENSDTNLPGLALTSYGYDKRSSKFDLSLVVVENAENVSFTFEYSTELFERKTAERIQSYFQKIMKELTIDPEIKLSSIDIISQEERHQILHEFNTPEISFSDDNVISLFEKQVHETPNAIALIYQETEISYKDLNDKSNLLAHHIKDKGISQGTPIPICIERGPEMIIGILAILKAGAAYIPIDPQYPKDLINYMLSDTGATFLVTNKETYLKLNIEENINSITIEECLTLNGFERVKNLKCDIKPGDLAYIIYTSGSTGKPKGVMIEHRSLANYLINNKNKYINEDTSHCGTFMSLSYSFDASIPALFMPLLNGKAVVIASKEEINVFSDENFQKYAPYDFLKLTPSQLTILETQKIDLNGSWLTRRLVIGGEILHPGQFDFLTDMGLDLEITNQYGPTEATIGCSTYSFHTSSNEGHLKGLIPIGKPIKNAQLYILNDYQMLLPVGVPGEIYVGGAGLAREYLNRKELTNKRFITNPFSKSKDSKLYRTGDFARWRYDGNIEFLGRVDDQVKIRGYRVELGQIEHHLLNYPDLKEAVVLAKERQGENYLVAYYVTNEPLEVSNLKSFLSEKLPDYMIPAYYEKLDEFPLN